MEIVNKRESDIQKTVKISTNDFTIIVQQKLLTASSHFFKAAIQSGMSESRSGEFFLPEFSPRQLQHLQHFLSNNDILTSAVQPLHPDDASCSNTQCLWEERVRRLIEAAFIADYLQMPLLKSKLRHIFQQLLQSLQQQSVACFSRLHNCNTFNEMLPIFSDPRLKCLRKPLLNFIYRNPLNFVSSKFIRIDVTLSSLICPIIEILSSDKVFFKTEDEIVHLISEWSQITATQPKRRRNNDEFKDDVLRSFMASVRLGLLTFRGLRCLSNLLTECPEYTSTDPAMAQSLSDIRSLLAHQFRSHFQTTLSSSYFVAQLDAKAFQPRADTPTMVLVARQNSSSCSFVIFFLDLLHGNVLSIPTPLSVERTLLFEPSESNPIHIATAETLNCQNLVFLFIHQINTATLKGLIWDLANLESQWLPELDLKHSSFDWAADSFVTFSLPHAVGVVYTADGLMVYCSFTLSDEAIICVYRFDALSWSWIKYFPKPCEPGLRPKVLKPMPHATPRGERWLYGALDWGEGSQFIRIKPCGVRGSGDYTIQMETLDSPDFILRAYNLVSVRASAQSGTHQVCEPDGSETGQTERTPSTDFQQDTYTFPFNACQRDINAMSTCFSHIQNRWRYWEPLEILDSPTELTSQSSSSPPESLVFSLLRNHIGFRGVVCTSSLTIPLQCTPLRPQQIAAEVEEEFEDEEETSTVFGEEKLAAGSYFVMAGRLSQPVYPPSPAVSGLWLVDPLRRSKGLPHREPTFTLPPELDSLLHRATAVAGTVCLANWTALEVAVGAATSVAAPFADNGSGIKNNCNTTPSLMPIMRFSPQGLGQVPASTVAPSSSHPPSYSQPYHRYGGGGSDSD